MEYDLGKYLESIAQDLREIKVILQEVLEDLDEEDEEASDLLNVPNPEEDEELRLGKKSIKRRE